MTEGAANTTGQSAADTARAAVALVSVLERADDRPLRALVAPHLTAAGEAPGLAEALDRLTPAIRRQRLWLHLGPLMERVFVPALCQHLLHVVADPAAGSPDAVACAHALNRIVRHNGQRRRPIAEAAQDAAAALVSRAWASANRLRTLLDGTDFPDLQSISMDLLGIDGIRWVLETLDNRDALSELARHSRQISRLTLARAGETIDRFVACADPFTMFDSIAVVSQVDNLLTVAMRLLDALQTGEDERTPFVVREDEAALRAFGVSLTALSQFLCRIALRSVGDTAASPGLMWSVLCQITFVFQFSSRLGVSKPVEFQVLDAQLRRDALAIAARFDGMVQEAIRNARPGDDLHPLRKQGKAVADMLKGMGWS